MLDELVSRLYYGTCQQLLRETKLPEWARYIAKKRDITSENSPAVYKKYYSTLGLKTVETTKENHFDVYLRNRKNGNRHIPDEDERLEFLVSLQVKWVEWGDHHNKWMHDDRRVNRL